MVLVHKNFWSHQGLNLEEDQLLGEEPQLWEEEPQLWEDGQLLEEEPDLEGKKSILRGGCQGLVNGFIAGALGGLIFGCACALRDGD
jgi:hypothetical protein